MGRLGDAKLGHNPPEGYSTGSGKGGESVHPPGFEVLDDIGEVQQFPELLLVQGLGLTLGDQFVMSPPEIFR
jgi:hypothetical protein